MSAEWIAPRESATVVDTRALASTVIDQIPVDLAAIDQVMKARQHEVVADFPFVFAFEQLMHAARFSAQPRRETSSRRHRLASAL